MLCFYINVNYLCIEFNQFIKYDQILDPLRKLYVDFKNRKLIA